MPLIPCPHCRADTDLPRHEAACPACGRPARVCGDVRIVGLLGRGGMGIVYDARTADGQPVTVKRLAPAGKIDWKAYELFERSTTVLRGLDHPALPRLYAFEKDEIGGLMLVRERFDGGSLEERILEQRRTLDRGELRALLQRTLRLLAYLHGRTPPVLHRDIKASNLMFRSPRDWEPVLVDFDTVAAPGTQIGRTTLVVSPGYTAPEQFAGDVSPASDLYSLGATLLLVATGTHPDELPRRDGRFVVEDRLGHLDPTLRRVILRLVEPDKRERYRTAEEALADLEGAEPSPARAAAAAGPDEAAEPPSRSARRKRRRERRRGDSEPPAPPSVPPAAESPGRRPPTAYAPPPTPRAPVPWRPWAMGILGVAAFVGAIVGGRLYCAAREDEKDWTAPGDFDEAYFYRAADGGPRLMVVSRIEHDFDDESWTSYRLDLYELAGGTRLRRLVRSRDESYADLRCTVPDVGPLWCRSNPSPLILLDRETLEQVGTLADVRAANPRVDLGDRVDLEVDTATGTAGFWSPDGRWWSLDPATLRVVEASPPTGDPRRAGRSPVGGDLFIEGGYPQVYGEQLEFTNGEAGAPFMVLVRTDSYRRNWRILENAGRFFSPGFPSDSLARRGPIDLPGGGWLLTGFESSERERRLFMQLFGDGRRGWQVREAAGDLEAVARVGSTLVFLMTTAARGRLFALDAASGAELWRVRL